MLGIIKCHNYSFLLPLKNNKSLLEYWVMILNNTCSKIIIIIDDCYKKNVYDILGENISIINNINLIKNEEYDLCLYVNSNIIIDNQNIVEPYNQCRQLLPQTYLHNGYIDILKTSLINDEKISGNKILPYIMNKNDTIDIDTLDDWNKYLINNYSKNE
jgi:hypothetical protein